MKLKCNLLAKVGEQGMKSIEVIGKTVDEAVKSALSQLNTTEDKVEIDIVEEGSKGFLNLIGSKPAKVKVTVKREYALEAKNFLSQVLTTMGIDANIDAKEEGNTIKVNLSGAKMGVVIGYRGETLDSLQYLTSLVVNKGHEDDYKRVVMDTENYRAKREETLKRLAKKTAVRVAKNRRSFRLEPMNPYERRIIHSALQDDKYVTTYSEGDEPYRRIVIDCKNNIRNNRNVK